jgi:hypothetical protein
MKRTRTTLFLLLMVSLTLMAAAPPSVAADAATATVSPATGTAAAAAPAVAATGDTSCSCTLKCPCGCSPLAGAWTAKLTSAKESIISTFKFLPVNDGCTKFAVNAQLPIRSARVIKYWPDACDLTEFVGTACKGQWNDIQFTAIGYGVKRHCDPNGCDPNDPDAKDKVVFIAVITGMVDLPASCLDCNQPADGVCDEPDEVPVTVYVSYFDAEQDQDRDGRPDCDCSEAVICSCFETKLKRVNLMGPCEESKSFVACLKPCAPCGTQATGRAFFRVLQQENKISFVLTVKGLRDVRKATIQVGGKDVAVLAGRKDGDCWGLLECGYVVPKDCSDSWRNKSLTEIVKTIEAGQATVVVCTAANATGEITGRIEDP